MPLNTALVFLLLRSLTGAVWRSLLVAALFGWHPLRVESVAWVAERKDVLSGFFGLLSLLFYARYAQAAEAGSQKSKIRISVLLAYWFAFLFLVLGLMSKAMLVTWPFVMLLLDYWPLHRIRNSEFGIRNFIKLVMEKIPFFVLAAAASLVTYWVQQQQGAVVTVENLPPGARLGNAVISCCRYLGKLFWPAGLAVYYPYSGYWPLAEVLLAGVLLAGISVLLLFAAAATSLFAGGVAVVCWDAGAGDWSGASWHTGDGGSLHLYSVGGPFDSNRLERA